MDLIISVVLLMLFIGIMIVIFPQQADASREYDYGRQVFNGLENLASIDSEIAFYSNYKIDNGLLIDNVVNRPYESSPQEETDLKYRLIGSSDFYSSGNDVCLFFLDGTTPQPITPGRYALGMTFNSAERTTKGPCVVSNPCRHYTNSHAFSRPVLRNGRIVNIFIVICEA
jgi:hypothetical protein